MNKRAFSLVEVALSTVIVAGLLVAALTAAGQIAVSRRVSQDAARGQTLCEQMIDEIMAVPYSNLVAGTLSAGPSGAESAAGNRSLFNEVGDFAGIVETPPYDKQGTKVEGAAGLTRRVTVEFVNPAAPTTVSMSETGCVRVTVAVYRGVAGRTPIATAVAIRTRGWDVANQRLGVGSQGVVGQVLGAVSGLLGGGK